MARNLPRGRLTGPRGRSPLPATLVSRRTGSLLRREGRCRSKLAYVYYEEEPGRRFSSQAAHQRRGAADRGECSLYSHGGYRHCAPVTSTTPLSISGREEGSAAISGRGEGTGTATFAGRSEGTGTAARGGKSRMHGCRSESPAMVGADPNKMRLGKLGTCLAFRHASW